MQTVVYDKRIAWRRDVYIIFEQIFETQTEIVSIWIPWTTKNSTGIPDARGTIFRCVKIKYGLKSSYDLKRRKTCTQNYVQHTYDLILLVHYKLYTTRAINRTTMFSACAHMAERKPETDFIQVDTGVNFHESRLYIECVRCCTNMSLLCSCRWYWNNNYCCGLDCTGDLF